MSNLKSGIISVRNRRIPILWTGQYAQHLAEEHYNDSRSHPVLHIEAQQMLVRSIKKQQSRSSWVGLYKSNDGIYIIPFILSKYAEIKTCYIMKTDSIDNVIKQKGLGKTTKTRKPKKVKQFIEYNFDSDGMALFMRDTGYSEETARDVLNKFLNGTLKKLPKE